MEKFNEVASRRTAGRLGDILYDNRSSNTWPRRPTAGRITSRPTGITIHFWYTG